MNSNETPQEVAERLLLCVKTSGCGEARGDNHARYCPAAYRAVIASKLTEMANHWYKQGRSDEIIQPENENLKSKISKLEAQLGEARKDIILYQGERDIYLAGCEERDRLRAEVDHLNKCRICEAGFCGHFIEAEELRAALQEAEGRQRLLAAWTVWNHNGHRKLGHRIDGDGPSEGEWERIRIALDQISATILAQPKDDANG